MDNNSEINKFKKTIIAAKRAKQLISGSKKRIDFKAENPLTIALEEIRAGKIDPETLDQEFELLALQSITGEPGEEELLPEGEVASATAEEVAESEGKEAAAETDPTEAVAEDVSSEPVTEESDAEPVSEEAVAEPVSEEVTAESVEAENPEPETDPPADAGQDLVESADN